MQKVIDFVNDKFKDLNIDTKEDLVMAILSKIKHYKRGSIPIDDSFKSPIPIRIEKNKNGEAILFVKKPKRTYTGKVENNSFNFERKRSSGQKIPIEKDTPTYNKLIQKTEEKYPTRYVLRRKNNKEDIIKIVNGVETILDKSEITPELEVIVNKVKQEYLASKKKSTAKPKEVSKVDPAKDLGEKTLKQNLIDAQATTGTK